MKEIKDLAESKKVFEGELDGRLHCDLKRLGLRLGGCFTNCKIFDPERFHRNEAGQGASGRCL